MSLLSKTQRPRQRVSSATKSQGTPINKYYRSGSEIDRNNSPFRLSDKRAKKHKRRRFVVGFVDIVLCIAVIAAFTYSLLVSDSAKVVVNTNVYRPQSQYQRAVDNQLSSIKNRNKLSFDEAALIKSLKSNYPEISSVSVELPVITQQPTVSLDIAKPSFFLKNMGRILVVNLQGTAIGYSTDFANINKLPTVTDDSGYKASPGIQVLTSSNVAFINNLIAQCRRAKVEIKSLSLPNQAQELDLRTNDPYLIKFYLGGDSLNQAGEFLAARHFFSKNKIVPFSYLDVRVPGKVFYK